MINYIMISFFVKDKNTLSDIYNYVQRYTPIDINNCSQHLCQLTKNNILIYYNQTYELTHEGTVILNDYIYYYSKIIIKFFKSSNHKKYKLTEIRKEQQQLRNYLIHNKPHMCVLCNKKLPLCLLETAHLKPRCILNKKELYDTYVVEFMCRYCHTLYDNGMLSIHNGDLQISNKLKQYDLDYNTRPISCYNSYNEKYFIFHYKHIYNDSIYSFTR